MLIRIRENQAQKVIVIAPSCPWRSWYHLLLQMACEIPLLLPCRRDLSQFLPDKGMLYHTDLQTLRLTVWKLELCALQDKGISDATIKAIHVTTRDTTRIVYKGRWESFVTWCGNTGFKYHKELCDSYLK